MSNLIVSGESVKIYNVPEYNLLHTYEPFKGISKLETVTCTNDCQFIVSIPEKGHAEIVNVNDNVIKKLYIIRKFDSPTAAVFQNSSKKSLALGSATGSVAIYDIKNKAISKRFEAAKSKVTHLQFNANDAYLAAGCENGDIILYSVVKNLKSSIYTVNKSSSLSALNFHKTSKNYLAGGDSFGTVILWDINIKKPKLCLKNTHHAPCSDIAFSPINTNLVTSVGYDRTFNCYDVASNSGNQHKVLSMKFDHALSSVDILNTGSTVALGSRAGFVYIIDLRNSKQILKTMQVFTNSVVSKVIYQFTDKKELSFTMSPSKSIDDSGNRVSEEDDSMSFIARLNDIQLPRDSSFEDTPPQLCYNKTYLSPSTNEFLDALGISEPNYSGDESEEAVLPVLDRLQTESVDDLNFNIETGNNREIVLQNKKSFSSTVGGTSPAASSSCNDEQLSNECSTVQNFDMSQILTALNKVNEGVNVHVAEVLNNTRNIDMKIADLMENMRIELIYMKLEMIKQFVKHEYKMDEMNQQLMHEISQLREENIDLKNQLKQVIDLRGGSLL